MESDDECAATLMTLIFIKRKLQSICACNLYITSRIRNMRQLQINRWMSVLLRGYYVKHLNHVPRNLLYRQIQTAQCYSHTIYDGHIKQPCIFYK